MFNGYNEGCRTGHGARYFTCTVFSSQPPGNRRLLFPPFYRRGTEAQGSCDLPTVTQLIGRGTAALPIESSDSKALMHVASNWLGWFSALSGDTRHPLPGRSKPSMRGERVLCTPWPPHGRLLALSLVSETWG